jgi:hypothetical protein
MDVTMVDGDSLHFFERYFQSRKGTKATDEVSMLLLNLKVWCQMHQIIRIGVSLPRAAAVKECQEDIKYSNKEQGGGGIALANSPIRVKRVSTRAKHRSSGHVLCSCDVVLLIGGTDIDVPICVKIKEPL